MPGRIRTWWDGTRVMPFGISGCRVYEIIWSADDRWVWESCPIHGDHVLNQQQIGEWLAKAS